MRAQHMQCGCGRAGFACSRCSVVAAGLGVCAVSAVWVRQGWVSARKVQCWCGRAGRLCSRCWPTCECKCKHRAGLSLCTALMSVHMQCKLSKTCTRTCTQTHVRIHAHAHACTCVDTHACKKCTHPTYTNAHVCTHMCMWCMRLCAGVGDVSTVEEGPWWVRMWAALGCGMRRRPRILNSGGGSGGWQEGGRKKRGGKRGIQPGPPAAMDAPPGENSTSAAAPGQEAGAGDSAAVPPLWRLSWLQRWQMVDGWMGEAGRMRAVHVHVHVRCMGAVCVDACLGGVGHTRVVRCACIRICTMHVCSALYLLVLHLCL